MCPRTGAEPAWVTAHRDAVGWPATLSRARDAGGEPWGGTESVICSTVGALRRCHRTRDKLGDCVTYRRRTSGSVGASGSSATGPAGCRGGGAATRIDTACPRHSPPAGGPTRIGGHATVERLAVARHLCLPLRRRQHVRRRSQRLRPSARGPVMTAARTSAQNAAMEALLEVKLRVQIELVAAEA